MGIMGAEGPATGVDDTMPSLFGVSLSRACSEQRPLQALPHPQLPFVWLCSEQHPSQDLPHPQLSGGHPQRPPQHSSLGISIKPNGTPRSFFSMAVIG